MSRAIRRRKPFDAIRFALLQSKPGAARLAAFQRFRRECPPPSIPKASHWLNARRLGLPGETQFVKNFQKLALDFLIPMDIKRELSWAFARLEPHKEKIARFCELALQFQNSILSGNYAQANTVVKWIEEEVGVSLWLIENKLTLLQLEKGLEAQKTFSDLIHEQSGNSLAAFYANKVSERNEETVSFERFAARFKRTVSSYNQRQNTYFQYRVLRQLPTDQAEVAAILSFEYQLPIVDLYESLVELMAASVLRRDLIPGEYVLRFVNSYSDSDFRLSRIRLLLLGTEPRKEFEMTDGNASDAILRGQHELAYSLSAERIAESPDDCHAILINALAGCALGVDTEEVKGSAKWIARLIGAAYRGAENSDSAAKELLKYSVNIRWLPVSHFVRARAEDFLHAAIPIVNRDLMCGFVGARFCSVADVFFIPEYSRADYLNAFDSDLTRGWATVVLFGGRQSASQDSYSSTIGDCISGWLRGSPQTVLTAIHFFEKAHKVALYTRELLRFEVQALVEMGTPLAAIDRIVDVCLASSTPMSFAPIATVLAEVGWKELKPLCASISVPIILDMHVRVIPDSKHAHCLRFAYEEFLWANGYERPSELAERVGDFDITKLIYYLRNVCVPSVMDVSLVFDGSVDVLRERVAVCDLLAEIDPERAEEYRVEIAGIRGELEVRQGVKYVDGSRVYVNEDALLKILENQQKESFERYRAFVTAGIENAAKQYELFVEEKDMKAVSSLAWDLPKGETIGVFIQLLSAVRDEFLRNVPHGLGAYLSMRIRHGTLKGMLRGPVQQKELILQKDEFGNYVRNSAWDPVFDSLAEPDRNKLLKAQRKFSLEYDKVIAWLSDEFLHVQTATKPNGVFRIQLTPGAINTLRAAVRTETTFELFIRKCFELFWYMLEPVLATVRQELQVSTKRRIAGLLATYEKELQEIFQPRVARPISEMIKQVGTEVQQALDRLTNWFVKSSEAQSMRFALDVIINIAIENANRTLRGFLPEFDKDISVDIECFTETVPIINDILFIILDNAHRYSGMSSPRVFLKVEGTEDGSISILVKNTLSERVDKEITINKLRDVHLEIESGGSLEALSKEGRTGLKRLKYIIDPENARDDALAFGLCDGQTAFYVFLIVKAGVFR